VLKGMIAAKLITNIDKITDEIDRAQKIRSTAVGNFVKGKVVEKLRGNRSGRVYNVPGTSTLYIASAPGEPPASATGRLRSDIKFEVKHEIGGYVTIIGSTLEYAPWLEFGTSKMQKRPFLGPVFRKNDNAIKSILRKRWL